MDVYSTGGAGKLKLKGSKVSDGRVKKKKSKKSTSTGTDSDKNNNNNNQEIDENEASATAAAVQDRTEDRSPPAANALDEDGTVTTTAREQDDERTVSSSSTSKTEAERRYEEMKRRRLQERLKRDGVKTHKERVEELNKYLSRLSEHHDMPKIGPG